MFSHVICINFFTIFRIGALAGDIPSLKKKLSIILKVTVLPMFSSGYIVILILKIPDMLTQVCFRHYIFAVTFFQVIIDIDLAVRFLAVC